MYTHCSLLAWQNFGQRIQDKTKNGCDDLSNELDRTMWCIAMAITGFSLHQEGRRTWRWVLLVTARNAQSRPEFAETHGLQHDAPRALQHCIEKALARAAANADSSGTLDLQRDRLVERQH